MPGQQHHPHVWHLWDVGYEWALLQCHRDPSVEQPIISQERSQLTQSPA